MNGIIIRALEPSEWEAFRDFRLEKRSPEKWRAEMKGPGHQVFGLFDGKLLIGITAVFTYRGDLTGQTALLAMSFISPSHRGRSLSSKLYDARLAWIRAQPQFQRVLVSHRKSNEASRRANQRYGFVQTTEVSRVWPDGKTEDEIFYELEISNKKAR